MSNIKILGFPNETAQAYTTAKTISSTYDPALMGPEWLKTEAPTERARKSTLDPFHTQWGFDTSLIPLTIDGLALANHNLADGSQYRFTAWNGATLGYLNPPTVTTPDMIVASTNLTGVTANVDEGIAAPDGLNMAPTNPALPWSVTVKFFNLVAGTYNTNADGMALVVRARRVFTGAGATNPVSLPVLTASLAAPAFPLGYRAVTVSSTGGQVFIFPFRRSDFTSTTNLQATLAFTPGISLSGGQYAVLEVAAVYYEVITAASPTLTSEWMTWQTDSRGARIAPTQHLHYFPAAPWTNVIGYGIEIRSDQAIHNPLTATGGVIVPAGVVPTDPLSYVEAGVFTAGRAIIPASGVRYGAGPMGGVPETVSLSSTSAGGQGYGADAYGFRSSPPLELIVTRDELLLLQDQLGFRKGNNAPFYVAIEPEVAMRYQLFTSYWATLKSMSEPRPFGRYKADGSMKFLVEVSFQEKL